MNSMSLSSMTGIPAKSGKKKSRRAGRGKPGASHLANLTKAHGAGDWAQAKTHALNYAKSVHSHMTQSASYTPDGDADDASYSASSAATTPQAPTMGTPSKSGASKLAAMMKTRKPAAPTY